MARKKCKGTELNVFKGREAKLNRAIFQTLAMTGPQTIYDLHKNFRTQKELKKIHYGNVNKRVRALEKIGYVRVDKIQKTKSGFDATVYELSVKTYLALVLNADSLENLLNNISENAALEILSAIVGSEKNHD